jgi:hypothetical protein
MAIFTFQNQIFIIMKKIFSYALIGAIMSVAMSASAQSTVTNVAAPTAKQAGGVAPKQTNTNTGRGTTTNQAQSSTSEASTARGSRGAANVSNKTVVKNNDAASKSQAAAKSSTTVPATKNK